MEKTTLKLFKTRTTRPSIYAFRSSLLTLVCLIGFTGFANTLAHKNSVLPENTPTETHRYWINFSGPSGPLNQILVGYKEGATNGFDFGTDAKMFGWNGSALYNLIEDDGIAYVIQGRAMPFSDSDVVKLGFKVAQTGSYTLSLGNYDGIFEAGQAIYVQDNLTQTRHNLLEGDYTFVSAMGVFHNRLEIVYKPLISIWTGEINAHWNNPENWAAQELPVAGSDVYIYSDNPAIIDGNVLIASITLGEEAAVTVKGTLDVGNINVTTGGRLVIANNANLLQSETAMNTGIIKVVRNSSLMKHLDYTIWSSPTANQGLQEFSPNTLNYRIYTYGTLIDQWKVATGNFVPGIGYMFRAPNIFGLNDYVYQGKFDGTPNNGNITLNFSDVGQYQGIGNPYPSNIDIEAFWNENPAAGTLYFWTNTNPWVDGAYTATNWAMYSRMGATAAAGSTKLPQDHIPIGQGFVIETNQTDTIVFNNTMRTAQSGIFFRTATQDKHRFWLNLSGTIQDFNQILIGYMNGATAAEDFRIDSKMFNYNGSALYSLIDNNQEAYVIQGRALPFQDFDVVPLGFRAINSGSYTISLTHFDGVFAQGQDIFLKDNLTQTEHNLKDGDYSFVSNQGEFNTRFEIVYRSSMDVTNPELDVTWVIYAKDKTFFIETQGVAMKQVVVYDMLGRIIYQSQVQGNTHSFDQPRTNQLLVVKVITVAGKELTKKLIY